MNAKGAPPEAPVEEGLEEEQQVEATPEVEASEDDSGIGARVTAVFTAAVTLYLVRELGSSGYGVFAIALGIGSVIIT